MTQNPVIGRPRAPGSDRNMPHRILNVPRDGMIEGFNAALRERGIVADPAQLFAAMRLQKFYDELIAFKAARRNRLRKLLVHPELPRGVWFWGGVGRGKTLLMDCFFLSVPYERKRRVHFHAFLQEIHDRVRDHRHQEDALAKVAEEIAERTRLMCFDEFHVHDIADAMILGRLMQALFDAGVIFCITSNYHPDQLYANGLHRERFLPTIELLKETLDVIEVDSGIDYRQRALQQADAYYTPADSAAEAKMLDTFARVSGGEGHLRDIMIFGRQLPVVRRSPGIIWFDFATLCGGPRSQNDYLELAHKFHTVFVSNVPELGPERGDEARRFTWLVDVLYDHKTKLILSAARPAEALRTHRAGDDFDRTVSRLMEMRSPEYLSSAHNRYQAALSKSA